MKGPDPDFPYLTENERFSFPPPGKAAHDSIVAWGGNLSPGMLLSAYEQGLFPWYSEGEPIIWHSPDPRFVIFPGKLHVSSSMKKVLKRGDFTIRMDSDFRAVITACSKMERRGQSGTWITADMIAAYTELHRLGWAHSAEAWHDGVLAGGCYGVRLGNAFFGESMFSMKPNASKAAFLTLARLLFDEGVRFIDCQQHTAHLESLGGEEISRKEFLALLGELG
jgi:leucyl/phenylalanyl-tRNA--protein transferase